MRHVAEYNKYASMYICEEMKTGDGMLSGPSILSKYVITGHVIFLKSYTEYYLIHQQLNLNKIWTDRDFFWRELRLTLCLL